MSAMKIPSVMNPNQNETLTPQLGDSPTDNLQAGKIVTTEAWVLSTLPYKEQDCVVNLFSSSLGRISAFAKSASRSRKRFSGVLEGFHLVRAQLRVPRSVLLGADRNLWTLSSAQSIQIFPQWRKSFDAIESLFFIAKFIQDFLPEGHVDEKFFEGVKKFLNLQSESIFFKNQSWVRNAFWCWASVHLGFGALSVGFLDVLEQTDAKWPGFWRECLEQGDLQLDRLQRGFSARSLSPMTSAQEASVYEHWLNQSGLHWRHFESWLQVKNQSKSSGH